MTASASTLKSISSSSMSKDFAIPDATPQPEIRICSAFAKMYRHPFAVTWRLGSTEGERFNLRARVVFGPRCFPFLTTTACKFQFLLQTTERKSSIELCNIIGCTCVSKWILSTIRDRPICVSHLLDGISRYHFFNKSCATYYCWFLSNADAKGFKLDKFLTNLQVQWERRDVQL